MSITDRILDYMDKHGITAYNLSKSTGIPNSTISNWKHKRGRASAEDLYKISKALDVTMEYFAEEYNDFDEKMRQFGEAVVALEESLEKKKKAPQKAEPGLEIFTTAELEMIADFRELSDESRRCVSFLIQKLQIAEKAKHPASDIRHFDTQDSTVV